jgi:hypothetical protein
MKWDSLVINKTEPDQSTMDVRIFDGSTGMLIPGSPTYTAEGEFDLSFIDPVLYPSIKLNGTFKNNGKGSPFLKYWGVSWKTQKSWPDTFFMGARVKSSDCVAVDDGSVECSIAQGTSGYLNSSIFTINDQYYYDTLIINKSESVGNSIKVTVYDGDTQVPISGFIDLAGTEIDVSSIDPLSYPKLQLRAVFTSDGVLTPYLYDWSVSWYGNYAPTVKGFQIANDEVYRNSSIMISIDSADFETEESLLEIVVKYQYKGSVLWYDEYIKNLRFDTANWYVDFEPSIFAVIGNYSFQVTVTDEYGEAVSFEFPDAVEVKNNPPGKPEVEITPLKPTSKDALFATASNSPDIENEPITYFYQWYKNNVHQSHLTTEHVSAAETAKGEVWRCEVTPRDSNPDGFGTMNSASVIIRNSAPDVVSPIDTVTMNEDGIDDISINLHTVFSDYDGDTMKFMCSLNEYIKVVVTQSTGMVTLTPVSDWYGITDLTFTANDTEAETEEQISVLVQPVNDAPKLISAGITMITSENEVTRFSVYELSWINLTLKSQDIDGDTVSYSTNRTDYIGTDDISDIVLEGDTLRFKPMNNHVGEIPVQIRLSDSRGGETKYDFIIEVLNTNNPPSVTIVYPLDNMHFSESQAIEFRCEYSDPDLLLEGSEESLFFRWSSNQHFDDLDSGEYKVIIPGLKLKAGIHEIKVKVKDSGALIGEDTITIIVEAEEEKEVSGFLGITGMWWIIIVILFVVFIAILLLFVRSKKQKVEEPEYIPPAPEGEAAAAGAEPQPVFAEPTAVEPTAVDSGQVQLPVTAVVTPEVVTETPPPPPPPAEPAYTSAQAYPENQSALPPVPAASTVEPQEEETAVEEKHESGLNVLKQLEKLGELRDKGIITEEEFQNKKNQMLN